MTSTTLALDTASLVLRAGQVSAEYGQDSTSLAVPAASIGITYLGLSLVEDNRSWFRTVEGTPTEFPLLPEKIDGHVSLPLLSIGELEILQYAPDVVVRTPTHPTFTPATASLTITPKAVTLVQYGTDALEVPKGSLTITPKLPVVAARIQKDSFTAVSAGTSYVVPTGATYIHVKAWGAGGSTSGSQKGGAGGYAEVLVPVTAGETLTYYVGGGGAAAIQNGGTGIGGTNGGGSSTHGSFGSGAGGGFSGLFRSSVPLVIAGGGGGGGSGSGSGTAQGGAGGGDSGQDGEPYTAPGSHAVSGGVGGTQVAGNSQYDGQSTSEANRPAAGGGYWGGKASTGWTTYYSAAGGGSGYVNASGNTHKTNTQGNRETPPNTSDADYTSGVAQGATANGVAGANGKVVISAYTCDPYVAGLL